MTPVTLKSLLLFKRSVFPTAVSFGNNLEAIDSQSTMERGAERAVLLSPSIKGKENTHRKDESV